MVEVWLLLELAHVVFNPLFPTRGSGFRFSFASTLRALPSLSSTFFEVSAWVRDFVKITFKVASPGLG
jgi:hypothetical protein